MLSLACLLYFVDLSFSLGLGPSWPATPISLLREQNPLHTKTKITAQEIDQIHHLTLYPAYNFSIPVDHFHNESMYEPHSNAKFDNSYWFDETYYSPGGPVFLLLVGEAEGSLGLGSIQKGIIYQLSKAFGVRSVAIEHRYFGTSIPSPDLSTKNMRFCTTEQALADVVYFAENIVFKNHEHQNLTARATPWITHGGSYAGVLTAFLRKLHPDVFWGAICSSGVTKAI